MPGGREGQKNKAVVDLRVKQLINTDSCNSDTGDISSRMNLDTTDVILGIRFVVLQVSETFCNTNKKFMKHKITVKREKTNKMQQSDVYYQLLSQHVSGIIMPNFRRTKTMC